MHALIPRGWASPAARTRGCRCFASSVHAVAAQGFVASSAAAYDAGRPDWQLSHARAALALAGVSRSSPASADGLFPKAPILELGAGTGKFTAALFAAVAEVAPAGARPHIICAEPSEGFAAAWRSRCGALGARGTGLSLLAAPAAGLQELPDGACSAAFAAQALHWMADDASGAEIARVLGSGRALVALWNCRDASRAGCDWVREYEAVIASAYEPGTPSWLSRRWEAWARGSAAFQQPPALMRWEREAGGALGDERTMLDAALSISEIARRAPLERAAFEARLRAAVARAPRREDGLILMPMYTEALVMRVG